MSRHSPGTRRGGRPWPLAAFLGLVLLTPARAEPPRASRWFTPDTVITLEVRRPALLLDQVLGDRFQEVLRAFPNYQKALEGGGYKTTRAVLDHIAGQLDTTWEKALRDLTGGGVLLAIDADPGSPPRACLVLTPSDPAFLDRANRKLLGLARRDAAEKGKPDPVAEHEYRGVVSFAPEKGAYSIVEGNLVIAEGGETLKRVIDRILDGTKPGTSLADEPGWKASRDRVGQDAVAWGFVRLDRLRALDPKKFTLEEKQKTPLTLLFGSWVAAIGRAKWASASWTWSGDRLGAEVSLPLPEGGYPEPYKGYVPPKGSGAPRLVEPPRTIASLGLWRDLARVWEARTELFSTEAVQGLAKLDGFAGQFFGGRDFGTGVLGALGNDWRLVVARQDDRALSPVPDLKQPAFALVADLKPDDEDFAQRLKVAFQSFVGLANLNAAQTKAPPLELGSETFEGVTLSTARYMPSRTPSDAKDAVPSRHNYSPSAAQVGNHFILSSSVGLARDLIHALKDPAPGGEATLVAEADGPELARLLESNRERLVMKNMLEKGQQKDQAEGEVGALLGLLRYLGHAQASIQDGPESVRLRLEFALSH